MPKGKGTYGTTKGRPPAKPVKKPKKNKQMWSIILATMLSNSEPQVPIIVSSYNSLDNCRYELLRIGKLKGYSLVTSPLVGYSVVKVESNKTSTAFCVKNMQSI